MSARFTTREFTPGSGLEGRESNSPEYRPLGDTTDPREFTHGSGPERRESNSPEYRPLGDTTSPARPWRRPSPAHHAARPSGGAPGTPSLRLVERRPLRVVDVALFYGERSGGIRTYLDAKVEYAQRTGAFEHHLIVPGARAIRREHSAGAIHELPAVRSATPNGYRWPLGTRPLTTLLRELQPDVLLQHDPFWAPRAAARAAGGHALMVHHGSVALDAAAFRGPRGLYAAGFTAWLHHSYAHADGVMSACDPRADMGRDASVPLRFGLDPVFRPRAGVRRGDHVLYAGRFGREKGVFALVEAARRSGEPWPLWLLGAGPAGRELQQRVRRLGLRDRVRFLPHLTGRDALARAYQRARRVVMPGELETFGLVAYEAAASGAATVACSTAPSTRALGDLVRTFEPGDVDGMAEAIAAARASEPDLDAALAFAAAHQWEPVFRAELADLERLAGAR
ncbi:glycosyltransferase [Candidatus Solirubrobacter pratensis]|uniref:glycosyltransferase n=1 Tax=Candidatus Solirubrobacter pratensis TaxID=1298857 RepID=UPI0003FF780D|nr:glycosyltransferase [Candidatus Solirubrobacter pratensis]